MPTKLAEVTQKFYDDLDLSDRRAADLLNDELDAGYEYVDRVNFMSLNNYRNGRVTRPNLHLFEYLANNSENERIQQYAADVLEAYKIDNMVERESDDDVSHNNNSTG